MSEMQHAFFIASQHKRKRSDNDISGISSDRSIKRPTTLTIRSPPPSRPTSLFSNVSAFSPFSGQLTPVDTSEDESVAQEDIGTNKSRIPDLSDSIESASSIKVHISSPQSQHGSNNAVTDTEMDVSPTTPARPRIGRARSNDILFCPPRSLVPEREGLLSSNSTPTFPHDRVPTPITGYFDTRLDSLLPAPRHNFPPIHTNLSPMIEQDAWGSLNSTTQPTKGRNSLPSPVEDDKPLFSDPSSPTCPALDGDAEMLDEATTSSMSSLKVSGDGDVMETEEGAHLISLQRHQPQRSGWTRGYSHARNASSQGGRTARLHMGFLAGCEKCLQKVPGHYSHILWSKPDD